MITVKEVEEFIDNYEGLEFSDKGELLYKKKSFSKFIAELEKFLEGENFRILSKENLKEVHNKYDLVYEKTTEEDEEFIKSLNIRRKYHNFGYGGGIVYDVGRWVCNKEKEIYFVDNDCIGNLKAYGMEGPDVSNLIYRDGVNEIGYEEGQEKFIFIVKYDYFKVDKEFSNMKAEVISMMKAALETFFVNRSQMHNLVIVIDKQCEN